MKYLFGMVIFIILSYTFFLFIHKTRDTYRCLECLSSKSVYQWHFGTWRESISLSSKNVVLKESYFADKFFSEKHRHKWVYSQGSPYGLIGGQRGCAIGSGRHQTMFGREYEYSEEFRGFINALYDGGELDIDLIMEMALNVDMDEEISLKEADLFDKFLGELPPCKQ